MRPIYVTLSVTSAIATSAPIVLDQYIAPGNVVFTLIMDSPGTAATVNVQHTNDDIFANNYSAATGTWEQYAASPFPASLTSGNNAVEGVYAFAPRAIRYQVTSATGFPFNLRFQVIQAGIGST